MVEHVLVAFFIFDKRLGHAISITMTILIWYQNVNNFENRIQIFSICLSFFHAVERKVRGERPHNKSSRGQHTLPKLHDEDDISIDKDFDEEVTPLFRKEPIVRSPGM